MLGCRASESTETEIYVYMYIYIYIFFFTCTLKKNFFSHLADTFIQSDLHIRKSNYNYKLKLYKYYIYTHLRKLRNSIK